jgi:hypothetical protein
LPISIATTFLILATIVFREKMSKSEKHTLGSWKIVLNSYFKMLKAAIKFQPVRKFKNY